MVQITFNIFKGILMNENVLRTPKDLPVTDPTEIYIRSVASIPAMLHGLIESIEILSNHVSILALYFEKRGLVDGIISSEDLTDESAD